LYQHQPILLKLAKKYSESWHQDIMQEVWIKVWRSWDIYRAKSTSPDIAMLKQITKSMSIDFLRREKYDKTFESNDIVYEINIDRSIDIENLNLRQVIKDCINQLPNIRLRHIAIHVFVKDNPIDTILEDLSILGCEIDRARLYRDITQIKKYLIQRIKNWKNKTDTKLKFDIDFDLGD